MRNELEIIRKLTSSSSFLTLALALDLDQAKSQALAQALVFLKIWREMGREVKIIILHVEILLYH